MAGDSISAGSAAPRAYRDGDWCPVRLLREGGAADGFNIMAPALPSGLEAFIEHVLPILRGKGLFRGEYTGTTLREHYGLAVPVNQFHLPSAAGAVAGA
jgi:hypothetical protein